MKNIRISIVQLENLLDVAKKNADSFDSNNIVNIELLEQSDSHNRADKLRFTLESAWAECNSKFIGTN